MLQPFQILRDAGEARVAGNRVGHIVCLYLPCAKMVLLQLICAKGKSGSEIFMLSELVMAHCKSLVPYLLSNADCSPTHVRCTVHRLCMPVIRIIRPTEDTLVLACVCCHRLDVVVSLENHVLAQLIAFVIWRLDLN